MSQKKLWNSITLEHFLKVLPGHIYWKDLDGYYLGANQEQAESFGITHFSEVHGYHEQAILSGKNAARLSAVDRMVATTGKTHLAEESVELPCGKQAVMLSKKAPLYNEDGKIMGVIGTSIDITSMKEYEQTLYAAKQKAEMASLAKSEFIANMNHDIRTPLSGMIGMAETIAEKSDDDEIKQYAGYLSDASHQLLDLLNEIIDLSKCEQLDMGKIGEHFSLRTLCQQVEQLILPTIREKSLGFEVMIDKGVPATVYGSRLLMHRVLINLLGNAVKFTDTGGIKAHCKLIEKDGRRCLVQFIVQDTGIGIAAEEVDRIFDPFTRLSASYHGVYKGTGLGLYVVKSFVQAMSGDITVTSEVGRGSTFTCTVPFEEYDTVEDEDAEPVTSDQKTSDQAAPIKGRVLVVEDDMLSQRMATMMLESYYKDIDVVGTAHDAFSAIIDNRYDMVFMDIGLPDLEGHKITEKIRAWEGMNQRPHVPIVALTAHIEDDARESCLSSGMNQILTKPLRRADIEATIESVRLAIEDEAVELDEAG